MYPDLETGGPSLIYQPGEFSKGLPAHQGGACNDVFWAILFVAHIIVVFVLAAYGGTSMKAALSMDATEMMKMKMTNDNPLARANIPWDVIGQLAIVALVAAVAGLVVGMLWIWLMRTFPRQLIIGTMIVQGALWIAGGIWMLYIGAYIGAIFGLLGACLTFCMWFMWRHRIPFAAALLSTVANVTKRFPGTIAVCFIALIVQALWSGLWGFASATSMFYATTQAVGAILYVFFLLSLYWTAEVIRNTGHTTVSGTFATWYFMGGNNNNMPSNPTLKSAKRALTTSFGSICFGSLIVALIQTVRAILRSVRRRNADNIAVQIVICLVDCILGCIEGLVRYFNRYAYIQVAIYGKSFCQAAKDTWKLCQSHGVDAMINDSFIGPTLTCGILLGGVICFGVGALVGVGFTQHGPMGSNYAWVAFGIIGALIGMIMMSQAMLVVDSGVQTIFVCYAMDAAALRSNDPELAEHFQVAYNGESAIKQREEFRG